jgi:preprotein translocase subunit SecD
VAAPSGRIKVTRYFAVLAVILAGLYALVFFTGDKKPQPKLGLDLKGGTSMTLSAISPDGKAPNATDLNTARQIIENRVNASGVSEPEVVTAGNRNIVVNVANDDPNQLRQLVQPAKLAFRKVLATGQDQPPTTPASPSASAAPSGSATPTPSASATPSTAPSASASAAPSSSASPAPSASGSAAPAASASPSTNPTAAALAASRAKILTQVQAKLGPAWAAGQEVLSELESGQASPSQIDPTTLAAIAPFAQLKGDEVDALPTDMQYLLPTVTCAELNSRAPGALDDASQQVVACDQGDNVHTKYYLDKAKVLGTDVKGASSGFDTNQGGWNVNLSFTGKGQSKWTALTQEAVNDGQQTDPSTGQPGQNSSVAIVLDDSVVSAPQIQSVITSDAIINGGNINQDSAATLANQLKYGSLPLSFKIENTQNVSPTLGTQQMRYGILAGLIGIGLVVIYCLFYYRGLGLVVIASLAISGVTVFASLVLLGRAMGFALSLAGIAGFIVAIGITADSFVVFFERLKDEVKDGRTVRSAVPRAWVRARRTILSADAVSFLAAAILYWLAAGEVKGFAFTLGLSTIIDLLVVFLFTHPLVSLLSRSNGFSSPRFSGLGNLRSDAAVEGAGGATRAPRFGAVRTKES